MRILLIAALCVLTFTVCNSSVIGIDFGSEFFKVSLISPGKSFVVIENTTTKRKTENAVLYLVIYPFRSPFTIKKEFMNQKPLLKGQEYPEIPLYF